MKRRLLSGLTGLALFGCGAASDPGYSGSTKYNSILSEARASTAPSPEAPRETVDALQACVDRHAPQLSSESYAILYDIEVTRTGGIIAVKIKDSMLAGSDMETCLTRALAVMSVPVIAINMQQGVTPQSRGMVGIVQAAAAPIALLPIALVAGGVTILLGVTVYVATEALKDTAHCKEVKADCIVACNGKLPTGDFGFRFWNCVNRCMRTAGC